MKRLTGLLLCFALMLGACGYENAAEDMSAGIDGLLNADIGAVAAKNSAEVYDSIATESYDESIGGGAYADEAEAVLTETMLMSADDSSDIGSYDYEADIAVAYEPSAVRTATAGLLTGGEWNDNNNWDFWRGLVEGQDRVFPRHASNWSLQLSGRTVVKVTSGGEPVRDVPVTLETSDSVLWTARTDHNGIAYLFDSIEMIPGGLETAKLVRAGNKSVQADNMDYVEIELDSVQQPMQKLDLMLMVDTTGSMGDELSYLQDELENVIDRVAGNNANLPVRLSVNFYRDADDEYVVRPFAFTADIDEAVKNLKAQEAAGGGDFPEAVDRALENAVNEHQWEEGSVKLLLLVLDAPPHRNNAAITAMPRLMREAAEKGIRIIPVASSGIDKETEYLLRCLSITTGGTYTFLTGHSGIGSGHIEPTIGSYEVEKLNDMLVRIIGEYLK